VDENLKKYADALYLDSRMESANSLRDARLKAARERAPREVPGVPISGPDIQVMIEIFGDHIGRCMAAKLDSYQAAFDQTDQNPSDQDFADVLNEVKAVRLLEINHSTQAIKEFIGSRGVAGAAGQNVEASMESSSAHGHDRVLQRWKIWKAKAQLKRDPAKISEPEKQRDVLLPTYSRAEFDKDLSTLTSKSAGSSPLALVVMDLDRFKSINDGPGGHEAGDRALRNFAQAVLRASAGKGAAYRFGGDELCILLPNHSLDESEAVAERVRREVCAIRIDGRADGLSASLGVACFPESTADPSKLFSNADAAMYASKRAGGNRVARWSVQASGAQQPDAAPAEAAAKSDPHPGRSASPLFPAPDLSGRWEGWSFRELTKEWRAAAQEFRQDGQRIIANAWGPKNWARGLCASIVSDGATFELIWSYLTTTTGQGRAGDAHIGTHFFKYSERDGHKYLEGKYLTDRLRDDGQSMGSVGFHRLIWVSRDLKSALAFTDEAHWGLPKPTDEP
jgi:diguanylate cyclase (GGDEF)-like protein